MSRKKILVVDDDESIRQALSIVIKQQGYAVSLAEDAISAVVAARRETPDLIILDLGLPGGDGYTVMDRLDKIGCNAPVIILTAKDPYSNIEQALYAGAEGFLQKPPNPEQLLTTIKRALERSS